MTNMAAWLAALASVDIASVLLLIGAVIICAETMPTRIEVFQPRPEKMTVGANTLPRLSP